MDCGYGASSCRFDGGADVGVEFGTPFASESVGDFAVDGTGAQGAFRAIVGGADLAVCDEDEELVASLFDRPLQFLPGPAGRDACHQPVQVGLVGFQRGILQIRPSPPDGAGA